MGRNMLTLALVYCALLFISTMAGGYVLCLAVLSWYDRRTCTVFVEHDGEQMRLREP